MCYKIIFYKIFQNVLQIARDIIINHVTYFKKSHVFTTLNPKIVFEKTQYAIACSLINYEIWCIYVILYLYFIRKFLTFIYQMMNDF